MRRSSRRRADHVRPSLWDSRSMKPLLQELFDNGSDFELFEGIYKCICYKEQHETMRLTTVENMYPHVKLPEFQGMVMRIVETQACVRNAGFESYFICEPEVDEDLMAFEQLGVRGASEALRMAVDLLPECRDANVDNEEAMNALFDRDEKEGESLFDIATDRFYEIDAEIEPRLAAFIREHRTEFADLPTDPLDPAYVIQAMREWRIVAAPLTDRADLADPTVLNDLWHGCDLDPADFSDDSLMRAHRDLLFSANDETRPAVSTDDWFTPPGMVRIDDTNGVQLDQYGFRMLEFVARLADGDIAKASADLADPAEREKRVTLLRELRRLAQKTLELGWGLFSRVRWRERPRTGSNAQRR
jgi:hypothetical protein